ncbi:MAG: hypothetical protein WCL00_03310 [Bacteroidota bacterium]
MKGLPRLIYPTLLCLFLLSCKHSPNSDSIVPPPPPPDCDSVNVTYTGTIQPILAQNCYACHAGTPPSSGFSLESYDSVKHYASIGHLMDRIRQDSIILYPPMPQPPASKLSSCQIAQFNNWIKKNFPQ